METQNVSELAFVLQRQRSKIEGPGGYTPPQSHQRLSGAATAPHSRLGSWCTPAPSGSDGAYRPRFMSSGGEVSSRPRTSIHGGMNPSTNDGEFGPQRPSFSGISGSVRTAACEFSSGGSAPAPGPVRRTPAHMFKAPATLDRRVASMPLSGHDGSRSHLGNGVDSSRSIAAEQNNIMLNEEVRLKDLEVQRLQTALSEMSSQSTWEMAVFEERCQSLTSEKSEMLAQTDKLLGAYEYIHTEQNEIKQAFAEAEELREAASAQAALGARYTAIYEADSARKEAEMAEMRGQMERLEAAESYRTDGQSLENSFCDANGQSPESRNLRVITDGNAQTRAAAPRASIESFTSATSATSRATAVLSAEKMQQMVEVDALQEAFEDASAKAEKACMENEGLRAENERLRLEMSETLEKAAMDAAGFRGQLAKASKLESAMRLDVERLEAALMQATGEADADSLSLRSEIQRMEGEIQTKDNLLQDKSQQLDASTNREIDTQLKLEAIRLENERLKEASPATAAGSEGRLRAVMTSQHVSSDDLKSAIGAVEALIGEAQRELGRSQLRERRAAFEELGAARDKADENLIAAAVVKARKVGLDDTDIAKAEEQLLQLRSMTDEQKAARVAREEEAVRKKEAFLLVKKDDIENLQKLISGLDDNVRWMDWRDYAGRTLSRCAQDLRAERVKPVLASLLGVNKPAPDENGGMRSWKAVAEQAARMRSQSLDEASDESPSSSASNAAGEKPRTPSGGGRASSFFAGGSTAGLAFYDEAEVPATASTDKPIPEEAAEPVDTRPDLSDEELVVLKTKAMRAVVQDDPATLEEVFALVREDIWSSWANKAGKTLLLLSEERGSSLAYGATAKALGLVQEIMRDFFEEREDVWIYLPDDVAPRRATVMQDTPEEDEQILIEYWDGEEKPHHVARAMVRKMEKMP